jgi:hypothetical protein
VSSGLENLCRTAGNATDWYKSKARDDKTSSKVAVLMIANTLGVAHCMNTSNDRRFNCPISVVQLTEINEWD